MTVAAAQALNAVRAHLDRCALAAKHREGIAAASALTTSPGLVGTPRTTAVTLVYGRGAHLRIQVKRARVPRPGEAEALDPKQQGAVARDAAIIAMLLYAGARVEECVRLDLDDVAITARTGTIRLHGKGDEVREVLLPDVARERISAWVRERGTQPGPLWTDQRGPLTISGITHLENHAESTGVADPGSPCAPPMASSEEYFVVCF